MSARYRNYDQFRRDVLNSRSGPMYSPAEDIADDLYHQEFTPESDNSMWDKYDDDDE